MANLTNQVRGLISKAIARMAESIENGSSGGHSGMMVMLPMQMNQQAMQQQMFQQSIKMQMNALGKRARMSKKYLRHIAKHIGGGGKRRKKDNSSSSSSSSSSCIISTTFIISTR